MWSGISVSNSSLLREMHPKRRITFFTVVFLGCAIIIFLFAYEAFGKDTKRDPTLRSVHIVFRHGARTPSSSYPMDPYVNKIWIEGNGGLTNEGKKQTYKLGQTIKNLYGWFVGDKYVPDGLFTRSSYAPRCQMSLLTLLAALFPPKGEEIWNEDIPWQPIPINSVPRDADKVIVARVKCNAYIEEKKRSDEEIHLQTDEKHKELYQYLSSNTGKEINSINQVEELYYTLMIQEEIGLKLPGWAQKVYPKQMVPLAEMTLASYTRTDILKKFQAGPMLGDWIDHFNDVKKKTKLYLYSAHDITLINIMRTLGFEELFMPKYGAALIVELHESITSKGEDKFIKFFYLNSSSTTQPHQLILPQCKSDCPLKEFISTFQSYVPQNWSEECGNEKR